MRKPCFDDFIGKTRQYQRPYDTVMGDDGVWYVVFPSAEAREQYFGFKDLEVATVSSPNDAYKTDVDYIRNIGWRNAAEKQTRSGADISAIDEDAEWVDFAPAHGVQ